MSDTMMGILQECRDLLKDIRSIVKKVNLAKLHYSYVGKEEGFINRDCGVGTAPVAPENRRRQK